VLKWDLKVLDRLQHLKLSFNNQQWSTQIMAMDINSINSSSSSNSNKTLSLISVNKTKQEELAQ
jgi:hypothetical protein